MQKIIISYVNSETVQRLSSFVEIGSSIITRKLLVFTTLLLMANNAY